MYFKIKDSIMFRKYEEYGYITDNSMFGYRWLNDNSEWPGEEYVSESGAVMLDALSKIPKHIDSIVEEFLNIFIDVDYEELKNDTIEFYNIFVEAGFLISGETLEDCEKKPDDKSQVEVSVSEFRESIVSGDCSKKIFHQNDFLRSLHIEIANECNERCVHCYIPHEYKTKMISSDLFYRVIEDGRKMNIINVTLSGGEPLLHEDFVEFLIKCRELDLSVNVLTNLTLLTDRIIEEMKKNPLLSVQTSIYSMNSEVHDSITKVKGSFEKTKNSLLRLKQNGIPLQISCPIMKENQGNFIDVVKWAKENNIAIATEYVIFASYDHTNCNLIHRLTLGEIEKAFDKQTSSEYINTLYQLASEKCQQKAEDPVCSICRYYLCVSAEGTVFPCIGWQTNVIGDLSKQTIKEVWEESEDIRRLRNIKWSSFSRCMKCDNRGYCTVCMMSNSNENPDGNPFKIDEYHCEVAAMIHKKVDFQRCNCR